MNRFNFSLRRKLIWSALLCFLLPLAGIYLMTNYLTKDLLLERAVASSEDGLRAIQSEVNSVLDQTLEISNVALMNSEIRQQIQWGQKKKGSPEEKDDYHLNYSRLIRMLDELLRQYDDFYVTILGKNDFTYTNYSYSDYNPYKLSSQPWFEKLDHAPAFSTYWVGLQPNYYDGVEKKESYVLTIGRPIRTSSNSIIGYVVISVNERKINSLLTKNRGQNQQIMLLNEEGTVLSHSDRSLIGSRMDWWSQDEHERTIDINGDKYVYAEQSIHANDWKLVSLIPLSSAISKNRQILLISFVLQALFFTIFCILLTVLIATFTRPIRDLSRFITHIGRGRLDMRSGIRGHNEVTLLARTIDNMLDRIESMVDQITIEQAGKRKAELEMLQAQINPHFMFNLLNSIRFNILSRGDRENAELIESLSSLLRMTINRDNEFITLQEEIDTIGHYTRLMNFRHANQVRLDVSLNPGCERALVPRFMIQPFIENAIIHGFEQFDGDIFIEAELIEQQGSRDIKITVRDNGAGMSKSRLEELHAKMNKDQGDVKEGPGQGFSGIGVLNVFQRLRLIYGGKVYTELQSEEDVGTVIVIQFPYETKAR
ncbi:MULTISPECIES: sensor histidine kinase [unclassified Paenibacillus]|uniref:sensor histidine kinase n=1 Tax=unclassified Paenibacillus TaxID=185978 RepID=UPI00083987C9|nr:MULTISPECIES: sensor histidine kinase [unclassified Paenibacillus]NWL87897.1 sensor histidine kinase [Paenibacillus sp. 79R4]